MLTHSLCFPSLAKQVLRYAARFAADWACLELLTHTLYFPSLAKHRIGMRYSAHGLWYGPLEIGMFMKTCLGCGLRRMVCGTGFWSLVGAKLLGCGTGTWSAV